MGVSYSGKEHALCRDVTVCILDRPRHADLIRECREAGARIRLISDGDVAGQSLERAVCMILDKGICAGTHVPCLQS